MAQRPPPRGQHRRATEMERMSERGQPRPALGFPLACAAGETRVPSSGTHEADGVAKSA